MIDLIKISLIGFMPFRFFFERAGDELTHFSTNNPYNLQVSAVEENGARSEREYDAAGQLISYTDSNGHTFRYAYAGGNR
uniref:hypothetical protein n=1 Tax=Paenibacillus harenae TaxID=306543 RepID=UPI00359437A5